MFVVDQGTYPFDILVCIGCDHEEIVAKLKKLGTKLDEEETEKLWMSGVGRTVMIRSGQTILILKDIKNKCSFHANLFHEVFHAVEFLFDRIGIKHGEDSSEAFAYQIGYLTRSIYEKLIK